MKKIKKKIYISSKKIGDKFGFDLPYFVENGFWTVLDQFINSGITLGISIIFARFLTKQTYSEYQLINSIINLFSIFSITGLSSSIVRSVSLGFEQSYTIATRYSFKKSFWAFPFFAGVVIWYFYKQNINLSISLIISSLFFPYFMAFNKWGAFWQAKEKFNKNTIQRILQNGILFCGLSLAAIFSHNLILLVLIYLTVNTLFNFLWHKNVLKALSNKKYDETCIKYGNYLTKINVINLITNNFDKLLVGFINIKLLAVYAIALSLIDLGSSFIKSFYSITYPKFIKNNIKIKLIHILILFSFAFLGSLMLFFIAKPIIVYVYSNSYLESAILFRKLVFVFSIIFINSLLSYKIIAEKKKRKIIYFNTIAPIFSIIISIICFLISQSIELFIITKVFSFHGSRLIILLLPIKEKG